MSSRGAPDEAHASPSGDRAARKTRSCTKDPPTDCLPTRLICSLSGIWLQHLIASRGRSMHWRDIASQEYPSDFWPWSIPPKYVIRMAHNATKLVVYATQAGNVCRRSSHKEHMFSEQSKRAQSGLAILCFCRSTPEWIRATLTEEDATTATLTRQICGHNIMCASKSNKRQTKHQPCGASTGSSNSKNPLAQRLHEPSAETWNRRLSARWIPRNLRNLPVALP